MTADRLSVASVCRALPTPEDPAAGLFVMRRLQAIGRQAKLEVLQPLPWFPAVRALPEWARQPEHEALGIPVRHAPMFYLPQVFKHLDGYWLARAVGERLRALRDSGSLDVIDAHFGYPDGAGCVRVGRQLGVPVFMTIRGVEEDYLEIPAIARRIRTALRLADGCICVSHSLRDTIVSAGAAPDRVRVIHNAVDRQTFRVRDQAQARAGLGIGSDEKLVVSVGNLLSVKRHDILLQALADVTRREPAARLVIIGGAMHEPEYPAQLHRLVAELGIGERVTFAGRLPPDVVADWLAAADVFALASRREGCCNAVLEALASGVPVVATRVGDNPWFVRDGENGFIVPPGDKTAMARALGQALARPVWDRSHISAGLDVGDWDR